jgi:hypothetical protein
LEEAQGFVLDRFSQAIEALRRDAGLAGVAPAA